MTKMELIAIASLFAIGLAGCSGELNGAAAIEAVIVCAPYGGLKSVYPLRAGITSEYEASCRDGKHVRAGAKPLHYEADAKMEE